MRGPANWPRTTLAPYGQPTRQMNSDRDPQSDSDTDSNTEPNYGSDPLRAETDSPVADRLAEFAFEVQRAERQLACDSVELHYQDKGDGEGKTAEIVARYGGED